MPTLTPISQLFNAIAASPFRVAPEHSDQLESEIAQPQIELQFTDEPSIYADYIPKNAMIRLGVPFISALWTAAHAYAVAYSEYQIAQRQRAQFFAIGDDFRVANAYKLYREARNAVARHQKFVWPEEAAKPIRYPFEHTDGYVANELFLVAISWIMHHEIAHACLGHDPVSVSPVSEEIAADTLATRKVCGGERDINRLHKRSMGIATAVMFLIALDIQAGSFVSDSHPPSYARLIDNLDITGLGEDQMIYAYAFVLLDIHLSEANLAANVERSGSFRDMCVSACMLLRSST